MWRTAAGSHIAFYPNLNVADKEWRKIIRDVRFRRALSLAINRHEINEVRRDLGGNGWDALWIWGPEDLLGPKAPGMKGAVQILGNADILSMAAGDVNGDGTPDIVAGTESGLPVQIYLGAAPRESCGCQRDFEATPLTVPDTGPNRGVALADIDKTIAALRAAGVPMKDQVEGQVGSKLRQSATQAAVIDVR